MVIKSNSRRGIETLFDKSKRCLPLHRQSYVWQFFSTCDNQSLDGPMLQQWRIQEELRTWSVSFEVDFQLSEQTPDNQLRGEKGRMGQRLDLGHRARVERRCPKMDWWSLLYLRGSDDESIALFWWSMQRFEKGKEERKERKMGFFQEKNRESSRLRTASANRKALELL